MWLTLVFSSIIIALAKGSDEVFPQIRFIPLDTDAPDRGEGYIRPLGASKTKILPRDATTSCYSEQVHVSLGDSDDSFFITFVNSNATDNKVLYSTSLKALESGNSNNISISTGGMSHSYSQLLYISSNLWKPYMGAPLESTTYINSLENTSSWAYSIINGSFQKWANYKKLSSNVPLTGLTAYNNPYVIYDSQIIHTVVLSGLKAGQTYYYKPINSCKYFSFKTPSPPSYPLLVGIAVDIGQTAVSNASINALISLNPSVVLTPGDLSYSDGFYALWDTFGNLIEPLASKIPMLTSG